MKIFNARHGKAFRAIVTLTIMLILSSTLATFADDGGGGGGDSGEGGSGTASSQGIEHVWYDRGGWADSTSGGSGVAPEQGYYNLATGWHNGSSNKSTIDFFTEKLNEKIRSRGGAYANLNYNHSKYGSSARHNALVKAMEEACKNAIQRSGDTTQNARIVGVAVTFCTWNDEKLWCISDYTKNKSYSNMFAGPTRAELPAAYGWGEYVNQTDYNFANPEETWRSYIYRVGARDNPDSDVSYGVNNTGWRVLAIAVTDNEPAPVAPPKGTLKLQKASANTSITG